MDLYRTIRDLIEERNRLDAMITRLETAHGADLGKSMGKAPRRRGRKNMSEAERREVSERMRKYWEKRRSSEPDVNEPSS